MSTLILSLPPAAKPLMPWERTQVRLWIDWCDSKGFQTAADKSASFWTDPEGWRAFRRNLDAATLERFLHEEIRRQRSPDVGRT